MLLNRSLTFALSLARNSSLPNDLVAAGPDTFYATSDRLSRHHWMQTEEDYLGLPLASVTYFDGTGASVAEGLRYANGINLSPDGKTLYVAEVVARRMAVFRIGATPTELTQERTVDVGTGLDNLEWGDDGELWTGAHAHLFDFVDHAKNPDAQKPFGCCTHQPAQLCCHASLQERWQRDFR